MTRREIILILAIVAVAVGLVALWFARPNPVTPVAQSAPPAPHAGSPTPMPSPAPTDNDSPISLKTMSVQEATRLYVQRELKDQYYDWKRPINFYGKVVDENNQPVPGAAVHLQWNTIDAAYGTKYAQMSSDGEGLFSLTGERGKVLEIGVKKDGYYSVDRGGADLFFEFADPSNSEWYEPDPNNPVIFHLRKKGEGTKLVMKALVIPLNQNHPQSRIDLKSGFIRPDGVLTITLDKSKYLPGNQAFPWTVTLSMAEGGLAETNDQFPFLAPDTGYTNTVTMDMTNLDRSVWRGDMTKTYYFYLPSDNIYGRMTVNASSDLPVNLSYAYNPTPGSRVLEPASK
jgi:hypothetical protein